MPLALIALVAAAAAAAAPSPPAAPPVGHQVSPLVPAGQVPELVAAALNEFLPAGALDNVET